MDRSFRFVFVDSIVFFCYGLKMEISDEPKPINGYAWIVYDPDLLGGKPAIKGTRMSVSLVLQCLAEGMTADEIAEDYGNFPTECIVEVLKFAAEQMDKPLKAA